MLGVALWGWPPTALICAAWLFAAASGCGAPPDSDSAPHLQVIAGDPEPPLALKPLSLKFAVIGDSGQWSTAQRETAAQLAAQRKNVRFDLVLMLGDNNYGDGSPESYRDRFEEPYKPLLDAGVKFYAARGNHDVGAQWEYPLFNMGGERYYTFERKAGVLPPVAGDRVQFFALDSVNLDDGPAQLVRSSAVRIERRMEDRVLPPSDLQLGPLRDVVGGAALDARAGADRAPGRRRVLRSRACVRTDGAADAA